MLQIAPCSTYSPHLCVWGSCFWFCIPSAPAPAPHPPPLPTFTHNFVKQHFWHTTLSYTIFDTQLCHTHLNIQQIIMFSIFSLVWTAEVWNCSVQGALGNFHTHTEQFEHRCTSTRNFSTDNLSHHSFTYNIVTHKVSLSHTALSHTVPSHTFLSQNLFHLFLCLSPSNLQNLFWVC